LEQQKELDMIVAAYDNSYIIVRITTHGENEVRRIKN